MELKQQHSFSKQKNKSSKRKKTTLKKRRIKVDTFLARYGSHKFTMEDVLEAMFTRRRMVVSPLWLGWMDDLGHPRRRASTRLEKSFSASLEQMDSMLFFLFFYCVDFPAHRLQEVQEWREKHCCFHPKSLHILHLSAIYSPYR